MSWLYLEAMRLVTRTRQGAPTRRCLPALVLGLASAVPAAAAEVYYQPILSIAAEENSNLDLNPGSNPSTAGYLADVATVIGISTPDSDTTIKPRVDYRDYPSDSYDNRLEEYLDLDSSFRTQRGKGGVYFDFQRRDQFNAEQNSAFYNETGPTLPTSPDTGHTVQGATRTSMLLLPDYSYSVSPLTALGVSGIYQQFNYSPSNSFDAVNFRYYQAKTYLRRTLDPNTDVTFGVYASQYEATQFDSQANAGGASLQVDDSWTPLFNTSVSATYQRTDINSTNPNTTPISFFKDTSNTWGAHVSAQYKTEIQSLRADVGRIITPSGGGGIYVNEQAQVQYARNFTRRLTLTGAAIALKNHGLATEATGSDRTYYRVAVDGKWMMTRTMFIQAGYQYFWQKYQYDDFSADNNQIYIRFGYQGLGRQF